MKKFIFPVLVSCVLNIIAFQEDKGLGQDPALMDKLHSKQLEQSVRNSDFELFQKVTQEKDISPNECDPLHKLADSVSCRRCQELTPYSGYMAHSRWWVILFPVYIYWKIMECKRVNQEKVLKDAQKITHSLRIAAAESNIEIYDTDSPGEEINLMVPHDSISNAKQYSIKEFYSRWVNFLKGGRPS